MQKQLSPKQEEFIHNSTKKWNLAYGAMRAGKTVGSLFSFMLDVSKCQDSRIYMLGKTSSTVYRNIISLLIEEPPPGYPDPFVLFRKHCTWHKSGKLTFWDKEIVVLGVKDEGSFPIIQGLTAALLYCDEMTTFPESVIELLDFRLSLPYSKGYASMNPVAPSHKLKEWIDLGNENKKDVYSLHFSIDDNPFLTDAYKTDIRSSLSGVFYKRNYLGLWCLAEGAIFDFFDRSIHVLDRPPKGGTDYYIAGIDFGTASVFASVLVGISTGKSTQSGKKIWVEKEYYWNAKKQGRQKSPSEYARDMQEFLGPYGVRAVYIDPSAAAMREELKRVGIHTVDGNNDVDYGIPKMLKEMSDGNLFVLASCPNLIKEIEGYVWDPGQAKKGIDAPYKMNDHALDALRYVIATHKVATYDQQAEEERVRNAMKNKYGYWGR